jgi:hypothetical protein
MYIKSNVQNHITKETEINIKGVKNICMSIVFIMFSQN